MTFTTSNPAVLLHGPESTSLSQTYLPVPSLSTLPADYVLLRIAYVGVCGSDVHFYLHGGVGSDSRKYAQHYVAQSPQHHSQPTNGDTQTSNPGLVMGHEASAVVAAVGPAVTSLRVGDRCAIEPGVPCRKCVRCAEGMYNLCSGMRFAASFHEETDANADGKGGGGSGGGRIGQTPGCLSRWYVLPEQLCYVLPEGVGLDEGVVVEPLAVAVHACRLAGIRVGEVGRGSGTVVVCGAGTIGLVSAAVACAFGAARVVVVDVVQEKVEFAKSWLLGEGGAASRAGAKVEGFVSNVGSGPRENATRLWEECGLEKSGGADVVLEASGVASSTAMGVYVLRTDGHMVQTGLSKKPLMDGFPITDLSEKEIHLHGAFRYKHGDFAVARDLLARGLVGRVKGLISNRFAFEDYEDAWKATRDGKGVKNLIRVMED